MHQLIIIIIFLLSTSFAQDECDPKKDVALQCRSLFSLDECQDNALQCYKHEELSRPDELVTNAMKEDQTVLGETFSFFACACRTETEDGHQTKVVSTGSLSDSFPPNVVLPITKEGFDNLKKRINTSEDKSIKVYNILKHITLYDLDPNYVNSVKKVLNYLKADSEAQKYSIPIIAAADKDKATTNDPNGFEGSGIAEFSKKLYLEGLKPKGALPNFEALSPDLKKQYEEELKKAPDSYSNFSLAYSRAMMTYYLIGVVIDNYPNSYPKNLKEYFNPTPIIELNAPNRYVRIDYKKETLVSFHKAQDNIPDIEPRFFPPQTRPPKFKDKPRADEIHIIMINESRPSVNFERLTGLLKNNNGNYVEYDNLGEGYYYSIEALAYDLFYYYRYLGSDYQMRDMSQATHVKNIREVLNDLSAGKKEGAWIQGTKKSYVQRLQNNEYQFFKDVYELAKKTGKSFEQVLSTKPSERVDKDLALYKKEVMAKNPNHVIAVITNEFQAQHKLILPPERKDSFFQDTSHNFYLYPGDTKNLGKAVKDIISSNATTKAFSLNKEIRSRLQRVVFWVDNSGDNDFGDVYSNTASGPMGFNGVWDRGLAGDVKNVFDAIRKDYPGVEIFCMSPMVKMDIKAGEERLETEGGLERWIKWPITTLTKRKVELALEKLENAKKQASSNSSAQKMIDSQIRQLRASECR